MHTPAVYKYKFAHKWHNVSLFLGSLDIYDGHYIGIIRNFYRCSHNEDGEYLHKWYIAENESFWPTIFSLTICVYLIVLYRSEAVESSEVNAENKFQH